MDQIHEQNNELIKGCGGASDLLNKVDDLALIRWETCSPDIARVMLEFEDRFDRIDLVFDDTSRKVSKKGQDLIGEKVRSTYYKGIPLKWLRVSSKQPKQE